MLCLDWWAWELLVLISGYLGVAEQASTIIIQQLVVLAYMTATGFESAASALVGQHIGKGDVAKAKQYYKTISVLVVALLIVVTLIMNTFRVQIVSVFSKDQNLLNLAVGAIWIVSINTFPDAFKGMQKGVIRGLGIQKATAYVNVLCHWCINLTLQYLLAFKLGWGVEGMWIAKTIMECCIFIGYTTMIQCHDWQRSVELSQKRNKVNAEETKASLLESN